MRLWLGLGVLMGGCKLNPGNNCLDWELVDMELEDGIVGAMYDLDIPVEQATGPVSNVNSVDLTDASDPLPAGLTVQDGAISGTPTEAGSFTLEFRATGFGTQCAGPADTFEAQLEIADI